MKKREFTQTDIERLFEDAVNQPPIISEEKVHFLLYHAPEPAIPGSSIKHFFKTHLNTIIMSTIIATVFTSLALMLHIGSKPETKTSPTPKLSTQTQPASGSIERETSNSVIISLNKPVISHKKKWIQSPSNAINLVPTGYIPETKIDPNQQTLPKWDGKPVSGEPYVMELTNDELKKLGVLATDTSLYYLNVTPEGIISEFNRPYTGLYGAVSKKKGASGTKPSVSTKIRIGNTENAVSFLPFYVNYSSNFRVTNSYNKIQVLKGSFFNDIYSQLKLGTDFYFRNGSSGLTKEIFARLDSIKEDYDSKVRNRRKGQDLKLADDTLVPIEVKFIDKENPTMNTEVLWFVSNDDFYKALPERYQDKVKGFYEPIKQLKKQYPNSNLVDYPKYYEYYDYMEGLNYIELSKDELSRIGIRYHSSTSKYGAGIEYKDTFGWIFWDKNPLRMMTSKPKKVERPNLYAVYYSQSKEKILNNLGWERGAVDFPELNELVPIRVKKNFPDEYELPDDLIFWYAPTQAFFDSLPPHIGNELKQEYRIIMARRDPNVPLAEKQKMATSCKYFEECKATLFDVTFTIWPNPIEDNLNIDLTLQKPDKISISLFSVGGRKLLSLLPLTDMQVGQQRHTFSAPGLAPGMYLLTIQNNKGQVKSQRVVKL